VTGKRVATGDSDQTRFWEKINLMAEISALCRTSQPDRETYTAVLERIQSMVPFDAATLFLTDDSHRHLEERASVNDRVDILSFLRLGAGEGLPGWISTTRKPVLLSERNTIDGFNPETDYATVLAVPLLLEDTAIGVISLGCRASRGLTEKHVRLMTIIADQLAIVVERRQFEQTISHQHRELEDAHRRLKAAQEQLVAQERLSGVAELAVSVNHEINNPLAVIIGNVQCLQIEKHSLTQKAITRLQRIEEAAIRISETNRKLLQINQIVSDSYLSDGSRMLNLEKSTVK
jgi:signal transduction protein with GAF and PtsI domain